MFDLLTNLIVASLFLNARSAAQATVESVESNRHLPVAEVRQLENAAPQINSDSQSVGVKLTAQSVLAVDRESGKILYEKNPLDRRSIASITKLMTALVFLDHNPGWHREVTISTNDYREGGINRLIAGEKISVRDVFHTALVASANEATVALARSTGLNNEEFVRAMNDKAVSLGMNNTHFADATGLDIANESSALDLALLAKTAFDQPEIFSALSASDYDVYILNKKISRRIDSTDKILNQNFGIGGQVYRVEAGKTGYLEKAGYCFASQITDNAGRQVLAIVLGSATITDRFTDTKSLAYWVYNNYTW